jgi:hypothetical protein
MPNAEEARDKSHDDLAHHLGLFRITRVQGSDNGSQQHHCQEDERHTKPYLGLSVAAEITSADAIATTTIATSSVKVIILKWRMVTSNFFRPGERRGVAWC